MVAYSQIIGAEIFQGAGSVIREFNKRTTGGFVMSDVSGASDATTNADDVDQFVMDVGTSPAQRAINLAKRGNFEASRKIVQDLARSVDPANETAVQEIRNLASDIVDVLVEDTYGSPYAQAGLAELTVNILSSSDDVITDLKSQIEDSALEYSVATPSYEMTPKSRLALTL